MESEYNEDHSLSLKLEMTIVNIWYICGHFFLKCAHGVFSKYRVML